MNSTEVLALIEQLDDGLDDLEDDLEPLLNDSLPAITKKLPVLDKSKLYVLVVYAIESLLFSYLRLHGVAAKEHAIFKELTRVRQYFDKIKQAESGPSKRENLSLNKEAAGRILRHHLAGNNKIDLELREKQAREALLAKRKLKELEQKIKDATPTDVRQPQSQPEEPYLSEGEIEDDGQIFEAEYSSPINDAPDQQYSEGEVEEEGKSLPRKRRKSGGNKSKQSPKSKKQKRKHASFPKPGAKPALLQGQG